MNHNKRNKRLSRRSGHRLSLFRNLSKSLINHKRLYTTEHKARALRPVIEKFITIAKVKNLQSRRRLILKFGGNYDEINTLFNTIAPKYKHRKGGYTRIIKLDSRKGDFAPMAVIELI